MSYFLNESQREVQELARQFARREIEPIAIQIDAEEHTPAELIEKVADLGFFGLAIPEEYGGGGADLTTACVVLEEFAKASPAFAGLLSVQMLLTPHAVMQLGTEEQKKRILLDAATGAVPIAWAQTEPAGAGNRQYHQTRLSPAEDGWTLNGSKLFCTQGTAGLYLIMCKTSQDGEEGYGCVLVEKDAEGLEVAPYDDKLGWRGTNTGGVSFNDVKITPDQVLGSLLTANSDLYLPVNQISFIGHSITSLGAAEGMFDKTVEYVKSRTLYGQPMHKLSPIAHRLADVYNKIEASRALLYSAARLIDEGRTDHPLIGSVCKAYVCEVALECTNTLLQMWGGMGIMNETGINRYMRDARTNTIAEGATEMHTSRIASSILGLA